MGCNCKTKPNAKYMDNDEVSQLMPKEANGVEVIGNKILQFFFGLLISVILIIGLIPALLYIIFCVCTGKQMSARIPDFRKWFKKE